MGSCEEWPEEWDGSISEWSCSPCKYGFVDVVFLDFSMTRKHFLIYIPFEIACSVSLRNNSNFSCLSQKDLIDCLLMPTSSSKSASALFYSSSVFSPYLAYRYLNTLAVVMLLYPIFGCFRLTYTSLSKHEKIWAFICLSIVCSI